MANVLYSNNFESGLNGLNGTNWSHDSDGYRSNGSLKMTYGAVPHGGDNGGAGFYDFFANTSEFHLAYFERFSDNWRFSRIATKGWQLEPPGGPQAGWKMYLLNDMWDQGNRGQIIYNSDATDTHRYIAPNVRNVNWYNMLGRWVHVESHIRLNTPGQADGVYREWHDGVC